MNTLKKLQKMQEELDKQAEPIRVFSGTSKPFIIQNESIKV